MAPLRSFAVPAVALCAACFAFPSAFAETSAVSDSGASVQTVQVATAATPRLSVRIDGHYKVIGTFVPVAGDVSLYEVTVSAPEKDDYVFSVSADAASFTDYHASFGKNLYRVVAVMADGSRIEGDAAIVYMGPNGEPATAASVESAARERSEHAGSGAHAPSREHAGSAETAATGSVRGPSRHRDEATGSTRPASVLSEALRAQFEARLDAIPAENRERVYGRLLERIEKMIGEYEQREGSGRALALLREIRAIVRERLDASR